MKYIIELEKIEGTDLWKAKGCNTLVFDQNGINNILKPYEEEVDWSKVEVDTLIEVKGYFNDNWFKRYFAKYEDGMVYTFIDGGTSKTKLASDITYYQYARLVKEQK